MKTVKAVVGDVTARGFSFAQIPDTNSKIYIPSSVVSRFDIKAGADIPFLVVDNTPEKTQQGVPYRAVGVPYSEAEPVSEAAREATIADRVVKLLDVGGLYKTVDLAGELGLDREALTKPLAELEMNGRITGLSTSGQIYWVSDLAELEEIAELSRNFEEE